MFCPKCGSQVGDTDSFCSRCGNALSQTATTSRPAAGYPMNYGNRPKEDARLGSFLLGLILGLLGLLIAVIIYNGNNRDFAENPSGTAVIWSILGMLFWFIIIFVFFVMILATAP